MSDRPRIYRFARRRNGRPLAKNVTVRACSSKEAFAEARRLHPTPDGAHDQFILFDVREAQ